MTRTSQSDRKGLGYNSNSEKKLSDRERHLAVRKEEAEHKWKVLSLAYAMQGKWLRFTDCMMADELSWDKLLWGYSDRLLKFLVNATAKHYHLQIILKDGTLLNPIAVAFVVPKMRPKVTF